MPGPLPQACSPGACALAARCCCRCARLTRRGCGRELPSSVDFSIFGQRVRQAFAPLGLLLLPGRTRFVLRPRLLTAGILAAAPPHARPLAAPRSGGAAPPTTLERRLLPRRRSWDAALAGAGGGAGASHLCGGSGRGGGARGRGVDADGLGGAEAAEAAGGGGL